MSMLKAHMLSLAAAAVMFTSGAAIAADGALLGIKYVLIPDTDCTSPSSGVIFFG